MNKEIKDKWVKALLSGEYQQCQGKLNDGNGGFCCLGVLTEVVEGKDCWEGPSNEFSDDRKIFQNAATCLAPQTKETVDWVDYLPVGHKAIEVSSAASVQNILIGMNDSALNQKSFIEIAEWIEENL